jgi:hypothetical protein
MECPEGLEHEDVKILQLLKSNLWIGTSEPTVQQEVHEHPEGNRVCTVSS